jgi:DNA-binding NarL/FixJ family response regulator
VIRVGVADDHPITRASLRQYLEEQDDIRVLAEAACGREAIELLRVAPIDVMILDLDMPGQSGIDALRMIKAKGPHVGVIVLSAYPEEEYALPVLRDGASSYLNKSCEPGHILAAVRKVAAGGRYVTAAVANLLATQIVPPRPRGAHEMLSPREFQVLLKLAQGKSPGQVAGELCLSSKTVGIYRSRVLQKLDARTNSDLTYYALKHGLIE